MKVLWLLLPVVALLLFTFFVAWVEWMPRSRLVRWLQARARARALYDLRTIELWTWWMYLRQIPWGNLPRWSDCPQNDSGAYGCWGLELGNRRYLCVEHFVRDDVEHFYAGNVGGHQSWILDAMADDRHVGEAQP